jgi:metal-sulfur cluster biosynthetic enzyme
MSNLTEKYIYDRLKTVMDPELNIDLVSLGLIYEVKVVERSGVAPETADKAAAKYQVLIIMTLTTPGCPLAGVFDGLVKSSLRDIPDLDADRDVELELTFDPPWVADMMSEEAKAELGMD